MSLYHDGWFTVYPTDTGQRSYSSAFAPKLLKLTAGKRYSEIENGQSRFSVGSTDGSLQFSLATLANANGFFTREYTNKCMVALGTPGGNIATYLEVSFVSFDATSYTLNFTKITEPFRIFVEVYG